MNLWKGFILEPLTKQPLTIKRYPDPILNQVSVECTEGDLLSIKEAYPAMVKVMNDLHGVGLAAVQVGILKRFCIIKDSQDKANLIINPTIIEGSNLTLKREGCLSLPFFFETIERFDEMTIKYKDDTWTERTAVMSGEEAQCIQHEIGHLNGRLIFNYVSKQKQDLWLKKAKKKGIL